jgi:hypothetical protein
MLPPAPSDAHATEASPEAPDDAAFGEEEAPPSELEQAGDGWPVGELDAQAGDPRAAASDDEESDDDEESNDDEESAQNDSFRAPDSGAAPGVVLAASTELPTRPVAASDAPAAPSALERVPVRM